MEKFEEYQKYRWFYTSSGKLAIGGKNALQNDELVSLMKNSKKNYITMHTIEPGSPFLFIISDINKVKKSDIGECAVFTGCFSRAWRSGKKDAIIEVFNSASMYKQSSMRIGTWGVLGDIKKVKVKLFLVLTKQKGILRAVPKSSIKNKKNILLKIAPGVVDKKDMLPKLYIGFSEKFSQEEILSALPAGGIKIIK
ncbi:MAG: NFACT RNA binding domain-containing protein [Nanoarchaeota archaeon]|mgnify:FL=1